MLARSWKTGLGLLLAGAVVGEQALLRGQDLTPPPAIAGAAGPVETPAVPKGVEVLTRGPIHEAFASLTTEAAPTATVAKQPPKPIEEMPPAEKPDGDVIWIGGYWAWDDDRSDYLWVSGTWRAVPPGKQWVAGYWRADAGTYQWVPGFWTTAATNDSDKQDVTYLPQPPAPPNVAPPNEKPNAESFYVPGHWVWKIDHYGWQAGYWAKVEPGYVWVAAHYRWTPSGYIYIGGYWDYAVSRRGILYAPVVIDPNVVVVGYVYTPCYAVHETVVVDTLWVRPSHCHYYFGDYYGVEYRDRGFESCVVYSRGHYDSIIVYETYEHRREPEWIDVRVRVYIDRYEHRESRPPRTLVQQTKIVNNTTIINNNTTIVNNNVTMVAPATRVAAAKGVKTVAVDQETRVQAKQQAAAVQQVSTQRVSTEVAAPTGAPKQPRVASLNVPKQQPVVAKPPAAALTAPIVGTKPAATPATATTLPTATPNLTNTSVKPATTTTPAIAPPITPGATAHPAIVTTTTPATPAVRPATVTTPPPVTTALHPTTVTTPPPATLPALTTTAPPVTTVKPATQTAPVPPPPPPSPYGGGATTTKPATTTPATSNNQVTTPKPGMQPATTKPGQPTTQPPKPADQGHKAPPSDKDKDKDKKDKDKNQ
jgi:hypothetical protein